MSTSALKKDHNSTLFKCKFIQRKQNRIFSSYVRGKDRYHDVGSGSLSSPMREHRNFAQFYCISVTNFSSLWMYPLGNYMNKKNVFFAFLWLFLCLHAMYLEKSPVDFLREVFTVCPVPITRSETWTKTVDVFIRSVTKRYALYTAICGITGSEIECRFQWCKRRGRLQTSLVARTHFSWKLAILNHKTPSNV